MIEPGTRFGRLTVIEDRGSKEVECVCDCGTRRIYRRGNLVCNLSKSCGCVGREKTIARNKANATHHTSRTRLYDIYWQMYKRCHVKSHKDYKRYGARGIRVCKEWREDPAKFVEWARNNGYADTLSIDRVAGGLSWYTPDNCRWATARQQANNRKSNHIIEFDGRRYTLSEFARLIGVKTYVVTNRTRLGWTPEEIYHTPAGAGRQGRRTQ